MSHNKHYVKSIEGKITRQKDDVIKRWHFLTQKTREKIFCHNLRAGRRRCHAAARIATAADHAMNERKIIFTWHPGAPLVSRKMITPAWLPDSPGLPSWFRDPQPVSLPRLHDPGMAPAWPALAPAAEAITRRGHGLPWHRSWRQAAACCILPGILRDHRSDHPAGVAAGSASRRAPCVLAWPFLRVRASRRAAPSPALQPCAVAFLREHEK